MSPANQTSPASPAGATTEHYLELLEKRLELLGHLAQALTAARGDLTAFDLDAVERGIAKQERLCGQIRALDAGVERMQRRCAGRLEGKRATLGLLGGAEAAERIQAVLERVGKAQAEVQALNRSHELLLRHSRRTVQVLLNSLNSFAMTYTAPAPAGAPVEGGAAR